MLMPINDIKIMREMEETPPKQCKVMNKIRYYKQNGSFQNAVKINSKSALIGGYSTYMAAKDLNLDSVECELSEREVTEGKLPRSYIEKSTEDKRIFLTWQQKMQIYDKNHGICPICGQVVSKNNFTIEHWEPLNRGGTNDFDNLRPAHKRCNEYKDDLLPKNFQMDIVRIAGYQAKQDPVVAKMMIQTSLKLAMSMLEQKVRALVL